MESLTIPSSKNHQSNMTRPFDDLTRFRNSKSGFVRWILLTEGTSSGCKYTPGQAQVSLFLPVLSHLINTSGREIYFLISHNIVHEYMYMKASRCLLTISRQYLTITGAGIAHSVHRLGYEPHDRGVEGSIPSRGKRLCSCP
jgi:hypothetical protein